MYITLQPAPLPIAYNRFPPPHSHFPSPPPAPAPPLPANVANIPLLPVPAAPLPNLSLACQPFDPNWQVHDMGKMDVVCEYCQALHWQCEELFHSSRIHPKFGMCCYSGKVRLPMLENPPPELLDLLTRQDQIGKKFRDHIR